MIKLAATSTSEEWSQIILVQLVQNWFEERSHPLSARAAWARCIGPGTRSPREAVGVVDLRCHAAGEGQEAGVTDNTQMSRTAPSTSNTWIRALPRRAA